MSKRTVDVLVFDTNFNAELIEAEVKDGKALVGNKEFYVDNSLPITYIKKGFMGMNSKPRQIYFLSYSSVVPADNMNPSVDVLSARYPDFSGTKMTPEMMKKLHNMKILGNMIKTKKDSGNIIWVIMALIGGIAAMYMLVSFGIITVSPIG